MVNQVNMQFESHVKKFLFSLITFLVNYDFHMELV